MLQGAHAMQAGSARRGIGSHWTWSTFFGSQLGSAYLAVPIVLLFALFAVAAIRSPSLLSNAGLGSAIIVAAPLILATYALTIIAMAGRGGVDLSIGPLIGFINVTLVVLFEQGYITSGFGFFAYAIAVGILYQLLIGLVIVFVRIQPIIVALSGFLTLAGLNLIILTRPGGTAPEWMASWASGTTVWSPIFAILVIATLAWFVFKKTAFYDHLRLMGSDERTAYTAGVNINIVRLGTHMIAGVYAAMAALCFTSLISSGDPTQGSTYTLMAVTALVLGGTSLGGGKGTIVGSLLGALNIYLITYVLATFNFGKVQSFVTQLSYGIILVLALLITIFLPHIQKVIRRISPLMLFLFLALIASGVGLYAFDERRAAILANQASSSSGIVSLSESSGIQSLSATSAQSLSASSLSASSLAADGVEAADSEPSGTGLMVALVIVASILALCYLLYRHIGFATATLTGVLGLLLLGYAVYDGPVQPPIPSPLQAIPNIFYVEGSSIVPTSAAIGLLASSWAWSVLAFAGAVLFGSFLAFAAIPATRVRFRMHTVVLAMFAGLLAAAILAYGQDAAGAGPNALATPAIGALVCGGLVFALTMPKFQTLFKDVSLAVVAVLSLMALGSMYFLAGVADVPTVQTQAAASASSLPVGPIALSDGFYALAATAVIVALILFLLMIPGIRQFLVRNLAMERTLPASWYLTLFITGCALLVMGAVFYASGIALWKFIVAVVAALIAARVVAHFLRDLRRQRAAEAVRQLGR